MFPTCILLLVLTDAAAAKGISDKELQHVKQLLDVYQAESAIVHGSITSIGSSGGSSGSHSCLQQQGPAATVAAAARAGEDEPEGSWAGELYEKDEVRGVERSYLKFSKRVARQPQQCARCVLKTRHCCSIITSDLPGSEAAATDIAAVAF
jgi:hypothetical protein